MFAESYNNQKNILIMEKENLASLLDISHIQNILGKVSEEIVKNDAIRHAQEEEFNIFQITRIGEREVTLHSRFIAELLNPRGTHKMNDSFLIHFMKLLCDKIDKNNAFGHAINYSGIRIEVERNVGTIKDDYNHGGSIDILLRFGGSYLIIENKIYADDQIGQLRRYYNAFPENEKVLVYLTLDGRSANDYSTKNKEFPSEIIQPVILSYKEDIMKWLHECKREAVDRPMLREVISQYINQVKILTNQTNKNQMENQIDKIILKDEQSIRSAQEIANSLDRIKQTVNRNLDSVQAKVQAFINGLVKPRGLSFSVGKWQDEGEVVISFFLGRLELEKEIEIMLYYDKDTFKTCTEIVSVLLQPLEIESFMEKSYANIGEFSFGLDSDLNKVSEMFVKLCSQALEVYQNNSFRKQ
jgi:hypothetical protein